MWPHNPYQNHPPPVVDGYNLPPNATFLVGLCTAAGITNNQFGAYGPAAALQLQIPLHWTGLAWTGFSSVFCDVDAKLSPAKAVYGDGGNFSVGGNAPGTIFSDQPTVLHLGVGLNLRLAGGQFVCTMKVTEFAPYNNRSKLSESAALYPTGIDAWPGSNIIQVARQVPTPTQAVLQNILVSPISAYPGIPLLGPQNSYMSFWIEDLGHVPPGVTYNFLYNYQGLDYYQFFYNGTPLVGGIGGLGITNGFPCAFYVPSDYPFPSGAPVPIYTNPVLTPAFSCLWLSFDETQYNITEKFSACGGDSFYQSFEMLPKKYTLFVYLLGRSPADSNPPWPVVAALSEVT